MTEARALRWSFAVFALLSVVLAYSGAALVNATTPLGIVSLQLAGTEASTALILDSWGSDGRAHALFNIVVDFPYLVAYAVLLALLCRRAARILPLHAATGRSCTQAAPAAAAFDAAENLALLAQLHAGASNSAAAFAFICAGIKFALLAIVVTYLGITFFIVALRRLR